MRTMQLVGAMLILVGLLFTLNIVSLATLVVDTSAPALSNFVPADRSVVVSINSASATASDSESGVSAVYFSLGSYDTKQYLIKQQPANLTSGDKYSGTWSLTFSTVSTPGNYFIYWQAGDYAGNWATVMVQFTIYTQLQGKWYINDIEIINTSQTIYSKTTSVSFKFQKTAGTDDAKISCWVEEGGTKILTLTLSDSTSHIWTGNYTFSNGKHNLALKANDGTSTITMSIINLQIGEEWTPPPIGINQLLGVVLIVVGTVLALRKKINL
jgi:hypothetical protein